MEVSGAPWELLRCKCGIVNQCKNVIFKNTIFTYTTKYWFNIEHFENSHTLHAHLMLSISTSLHIYIIKLPVSSTIRFVTVQIHVHVFRILPYSSCFIIQITHIILFQDVSLVLRIIH